MVVSSDRSPLMALHRASYLGKGIVFVESENCDGNELDFKRFLMAGVEREHVLLLLAQLLETLTAEALL